MITLHAERLSPDGSRARAALHAKDLPFDDASPAARPSLRRLDRRTATSPNRLLDQSVEAALDIVVAATSVTAITAAESVVARWGQLASRGDASQGIPWLVDGGVRVTGYPSIVRHLDDKGGGPALLPLAPSERGRAQIIETWANEVLLPIVELILWCLPLNAATTRAELRTEVSGGAIAATARDLSRRVRIARHAQRILGDRAATPKPAAILNRLAAELDVLDDTLASSAFVGGATPTIADVACAGYLALLDGLDGWETVRARKRVARLIKALGPTGSGAKLEVDRVNEEAREDADRFRADSP